MNGQVRIDERRWRQAGRPGFTLIELLVVMLIILLVSAVVLPTVLPAISHRQVSEAARILQGALAGARDTAINNNAPAGIRLLPDPSFPIQYTSINGVNQINPATILASNRFIPIQLGPDYSEGYVHRLAPGALATAMSPAAPGTFFNYPAAKGGGFYPAGTNALLYLAQSVYNPTTGSYNPPTSWYWNIRVGDKIQINNSGNLYTVVGPMQILPEAGNSELFVNVGAPGTTPPFLETVPANSNPEVLFLVNGVDDNKDGYVDNGWDGVDNDGDGIVDEVSSALIPFPGEWVEIEQWHEALTASPLTQLPYTITRRPVVVPGARETPLPSGVVIDLTTWNPAAFGAGYVSERSRLPVDSTTGYVDILLNPNGSVVPTTVYSSPSSFGMGSSFYHFWLAERGDLFDPRQQAGVPYLLPMVAGSPYYPNASDAFATRALNGERLLLTLFPRTGALATNQVESFNGNLPGLPF